MAKIIRPQQEVEPEEEPGFLQVTVQYGSSKHHISGPMGLYPRGVSEILECVVKMLARHSELDE